MGVVMEYLIMGVKNGILWDVKADKPLLTFKNGRAATTDKGVADKAAKIGLTVQEIPPASKTKA